MPQTCEGFGCKLPVPTELAAERLCLAHFLIAVEQACAEMRRETAPGTTSEERRKEILRYIAEHGEMLARAATSGLRMPDELKARVLNVFLVLMNLRENLDRGKRPAPGGATREAAS